MVTSSTIAAIATANASTFSWHIRICCLGLRQDKQGWKEGPHPVDDVLKSEHLVEHLFSPHVQHRLATDEETRADEYRADEPHVLGHGSVARTEHRRVVEEAEHSHEAADDKQDGRQREVQVGGEVAPAEGALVGREAVERRRPRDGRADVAYEAGEHLGPLRAAALCIQRRFLGTKGP